MKKKSMRFVMTALCLMSMSSANAFDFTVDGINYTKTSDRAVSVAALDEYGRKSFEGDFVIPDEVTSDGVTYKVTGIEEFALRVSGITTLKIGSNITTLVKKILMRTGQLTSVEMSDNVTKIEEDAFSECSALKTIKLSKNLETLERSAFYECSALETIDFPEKLTVIEEFVLSGCSSLKSISMGNQVKSIGESAFSHCEALETISIPACVETIDLQAFRKTEALKSFYLYGKPTVKTRTLQSTGQIITAFDEEAYTKVTLYVPTGTKADYLALDVWKNFTKTEEFDPSSGIKYGQVADAKVVSRHSLDGRPSGAADKGIQLVRMSSWHKQQTGAYSYTIQVFQGIATEFYL